ncbi:MAG: Aromatic/aminoadipate aminotransferase 1 [Candelina mexicana]|nr:MAG: Aromatic/aminoadipate aminotransferase 1 [Candelina mexicana]
MAPPSAIEVEAISDTTAIVFPDPLTVNGVSSRRAKAGMLNGGVAASTNSDLFKSPSNRTKPKAKRWDREWFNVNNARNVADATCVANVVADKFSLECVSRQAPSIKGLAKHLKNPGQ